MIEAKKLTKDYGVVRAAENVSFEVRKGEVLGFLGPNGAGKSTTMRMLTGFLQPTHGTARIGGVDVLENPVEAKKKFGYLPENCPLYNEMTVTEFLACIAELRGYKTQRERGERIDRVMDICHLKSVPHKPIETLSKGYRQRVGMAQALLHDPPYLIMDEPTDGLDPNQKQEVRKLIASMGESKAIILSTHILEEVEAMCNRVIMIANGRVLVDEKPQDFRKRHRHYNKVEFRFKGGEPAEVEKELRSLSDVREVQEKEGLFAVIPRQGKSVEAEVLDLARKNNWGVESFNKPPVRLEEIFSDLTLKKEK